MDLNAGNQHIKGRLASLVNTPDILLLPERNNAASVIARAGLELGLFHRALRLARYLVQLRLLRSLVGLAGVSHRIAAWFENKGSDAGGMKVRVVGTTPEGNTETRSWDLIAADGHGPKVPVQPISVMLGKIVAGDTTTGARPCVGEVSLSELEAAMAKFGALTQQTKKAGAHAPAF